MRTTISLLFRTLGAFSLLAVVTACSWIPYDLDECPPTELRLQFKYDYNMLRSDVFKDLVRDVSVFVFDSADRLVTTRRMADADTLGTYGYEMVFTEPELEKEKEYRFVTMAWQDDEAKLLQRPGAKFRRPILQPGDPITLLTEKLERTGQQTEDGEYLVDNQGVGLDTLWISRNDCRGSLHDKQTTRLQADLMRHTNNLTVTLRQTVDPTAIDINDFEIRITDNNGWTNYDNSHLTDDRLAYSPYAMWNTEFTDDEGNVVQRAGHADLSFPRLIWHDDWRQNARLTIYNKRIKAHVADINLADYLAQGRNSAEAQNYSPQEFLDREFVYKLDFFLKGDTWDFVDLSISVLSWSKRIQNINL